MIARIVIRLTSISSPHALAELIWYATSLSLVKAYLWYHADPPKHHCLIRVGKLGLPPRSAARFVGISRDRASRLFQERTTAPQPVLSKDNR